MSENFCEQMIAVILRECDKGNILYQIAAMKALEKIFTISELQHVHFKNTYDTLRTILLKVKISIHF